MPDLYKSVQKYFGYFQKSLFALTKLAENLPDPKARDEALDLISDTPELLDDTIGMPHEGLMKDGAKPKLAIIEKNLDALEKVLADGIESVPQKLKKTYDTLIKNRMKVVRKALADITSDLENFVEDMARRAEQEKKLREKAEQKAEKDRLKAEKDRQKIEKREKKELENADWCENNCDPCKDNPYANDDFGADDS